MAPIAYNRFILMYFGFYIESKSTEQLTIASFAHLQSKLNLLLLVPILKNRLRILYYTCFRRNNSIKIKTKDHNLNPSGNSFCIALPF